MFFGSVLVSGVIDDVDDDDAIDYLFGWGRLSLDDEGNLKSLKPEPLELGERDHGRMYRARVLDGDLPLVQAAPVLWGPIVEYRGFEGCRGLQVMVDNVAEFMEDVAGELMDSVLEDILLEVAREVTCEVCFEEDIPDVWEYRRRGAA